MAFLEINPRYRAQLAGLGLVRADDFLRLSGVIYCGHPDRHVARIELGSGPEAVAAFIKKEHRVRWKDRVRNAWAGFGFVSKSRREMQALQMAAEEGIGCPEVMAAGEERGRAFLLLRQAPAAADLRTYLQQTTDPERRRSLARHLGVALAEVHAGGFDHTDLYSKHILVRVPAEAERYAFCFLDWQRTRRRKQLPWSVRCRALAGLDASLLEGFATPRERLLCLRSYLRYAGLVTKNGQEKRRLAEAAREIGRHSRRLLRRPRIRELRLASSPSGTQNLVWLDGEALCVTREFQEELQGRIPAWLHNSGAISVRFEEVHREAVPLGGTRQGQLVRRRARRPWEWLWSWLSRKRIVSAELEQAAALFRLQRFGVGIPRLLAVGQRLTRLWRVDSFLVTEPSAASSLLGDWLGGRGLEQLAPRTARERWSLCRHLGELVCRVHQAGYALEEGCHQAFAITREQNGQLAVVLQSVEGIRRHTRSPHRLSAGELARLDAQYGSACSRSDRLRFLLAYLGIDRLNLQARRIVEQVLRRRAKRWAGDGRATERAVT